MRRTTAGVLYRNEAGKKRCLRCHEWLPEESFHKDSRKSDGLDPRCNRCFADSRHHLTVERRQQMLDEQDGMCKCGFLFDAYGGRGASYEIDHNHRCCPGRYSCGDCIWALSCHGCNLRDRNNPTRTGSGASKYRGVTWSKRNQKWQVHISRGGKHFYPTLIGSPCRYVDEDEAGVVVQKLNDYLDNNPQLWLKQITENEATA